jgi:hypothetical protein
VELDAGAELDATECSEVVGAELGGGTHLGSGCGRRMEARPRQEARVQTVGGRREQGQRQRAAQAESVPRWRAARASGVISRAGARSAEWACDTG